MKIENIIQVFNTWKDIKVKTTESSNCIKKNRVAFSNTRVYL